MPKRKIEMAKRHNSAFFKYSNQVVFDKREKEFIKNNNEKNNIKYTLTYSSKNRYRNIKQKFLKEKNIYQYLKTLQSINSKLKSDDNIFQTISFEDELKRQKSKIKNIKKKMNRAKINFNFFNLTETNLKQSKMLYNNNSAKYYYTIDYDKKYGIKKEKKENHKTINNYKYKGINELLLIKNNKIFNDLKRNESEAKTERIKDLKNLQFNPTKEGFRDYIEKSRNYDLINYSTKVKKERAVRLEEIYKNKIQFYKDTYNSLNKFKKLLTKFLLKTSEYLKFLYIKIQKEKHKNSNLVNEIRNCKNDIENINIKMKRMEYEKSNIIRWLYLQIQLKEKKLVLPNFYKVIFESGDLIGQNKHKIKQTGQNIAKKEKSKKKTLLVNYFKNFIDDEFLKGSNKEINLNENNIIDLNGTIISLEEYEKIKSYKLQLIYKTPEQFNDALLNIEKNNLKLINYHDNLRDQLFILKKKFNKVKEEKNNIENYINNKLKHKENELNSIKSIANINSRNDILSERKENNNTLAIYNKVLDIYKSCKLIDNSEKNTTMKNMKTTLEEEIIIMLRYIETKTDKLINKINSKIRNDMDGKVSIKEFIFHIKYEIDREHKNENALKQKKLQREKYRKIYESIEERNNKIYFLPKKKLDLSKMKTKKSKKIEIKIENKKENYLEDFLYH